MSAHPAAVTKHSNAAGLGPMSGLLAAFLTALVAMTPCVAFALASLALAPDATSFASAPVAQPVLQHTNTTGDLDVLACHPAGIYFEPMADDQSVVLSAVNDLLHREAIYGDLGASRNAAGLMTEEAVHASTQYSIDLLEHGGGRGCRAVHVESDQHEHGVPHAGGGQRH